MMDGYLILDKCDSNQFLELNITFEGISKLRNMIFECKMKKKWQWKSNYQNFQYLFRYKICHFESRPYIEIGFQNFNIGFSIWTLQIWKFDGLYQIFFILSTHVSKHFILSYKSWKIKFVSNWNQYIYI